MTESEYQAHYQASFAQWQRAANQYSQASQSWVGGFGAGAGFHQFPPQSRQPADIEAVFVAFIQALPYEAAHAAYKRAAAILHPDAGGDAEKMKILNVAWGRIEKEYFGK